MPIARAEDLHERIVLALADRVQKSRVVAIGDGLTLARNPMSSSTGSSPGGAPELRATEVRSDHIMLPVRRVCRVCGERRHRTRGRTVTVPWPPHTEAGSS